MILVKAVIDICNLGLFKIWRQGQASCSFSLAVCRLNRRIWVMLCAASSINNQKLRFPLAQSLLNIAFCRWPIASTCWLLGALLITLNLLKGCFHNPRSQTCYWTLHIAINSLILSRMMLHCQILYVRCISWNFLYLSMQEILRRFNVCLDWVQ